MSVPDDLGTPELFDMPAQPAVAAAPAMTGEAVTTGAAPQAVTSATCPCCHAARDVGLLRSGQHLVWRAHTYPTWSGAQVTCRASGVAVCVAAPAGQRTTGSSKRPAPACRHR